YGESPRKPIACRTLAAEPIQRSPLLCRRPRIPRGSTGPQARTPSNPLRHPSSEARAGTRGASGSITWELQVVLVRFEARDELLCDYEPFPVVDPKDADGNVRPVT